MERFGQLIDDPAQIAGGQFQQNLDLYFDFEDGSNLERSPLNQNLGRIINAPDQDISHLTLRAFKQTTQSFEELTDDLKTKLVILWPHGKDLWKADLSVHTSIPGSVLSRP